MNYSNPSCVIQKEDIPQLKFSRTDTLVNINNRKLRSFDLDRASKLGNLLKTKVKIYFKDYCNKLMSVNTTIWGVTSESIILKQGITIPISSVVYVE